jgi:hypothetical protein
MMNMGRLRLLLCMALVFCFASCKVQYSFTGASISPDVKTVSISQFVNVAPLVNPTLASNFTEALKERFVTQTSLALQDFGGDLTFSGEIVGYDIAPVAIQGNETAALNRLTITVKVKFVNVKDEKANFDRSFSFYTDYPASQSFADSEQSLVATIQEKLVEDVFNAAVANW